MPPRVRHPILEGIGAGAGPLAFLQIEKQSKDTSSAFVTSSAAAACPLLLLALSAPRSIDSYGAGSRFKGVGGIACAVDIIVRAIVPSQSVHNVVCVRRARTAGEHGGLADGLS